MNSWHSPQSIYNLGHAAVKELLSVPVIVEEKIDGSFFAAGVFDGELKVRSKGREFDPEEPQKLFDPAVATFRSLASRLEINDGWTYRGEAVCKPRHNVLQYSRAPEGGVILFDVVTGEEEYLGYEAKVDEAHRLGLEVVPKLWEGEGLTLDVLKSLLEKESCLGGPLVEGVVVKPRGYDLYGRDKKALFGKYVSEAFKETHRRDWKSDAQQRKTIVEELIDEYGTPVRWQKAIQHLRDDGRLEGSPRDIGPLIKEIPADILKEHREEIAERPLRAHMKELTRGWVRGFPDWYKARLLEDAFGEAA